MKNWRVVTILLLCLALVSAVGCQPFDGDQEESGQELVEVVRGDLAFSVSGSGNMVVANEASLVFGTGGRRYGRCFRGSRLRAPRERRPSDAVRLYSG